MPCHELTSIIIYSSKLFLVWGGPVDEYVAKADHSFDTQGFRVGDEFIGFLFCFSTFKENGMGVAIDNSHFERTQSSCYIREEEALRIGP